MEIPPPQDVGLGLVNRLTFPCQPNGLSGQLQRRHGTLVMLKSLFYPVPALLAPVRCEMVFFVPHTSDEIGVLAQLMVPLDCKKDKSCSSLDSIHAVQDYPCVCLFLWDVEMFYIYRVWVDILPWPDYENIGFMTLVLISNQLLLLTIVPCQLRA